MEQIYETIEQLMDMIHYLKELACVSFLVQGKEKLAKIVLTFEVIIRKRQNDDFPNKEMDGNENPYRFSYGTPLQLWTPMNPIPSIWQEMMAMIDELPNKIDYIKECASVGFLLPEKEKLVEIVITLEKIINEKQKMKINNNM